MPYWRLFYHVVWGTKNRLPLIESAWEADLHGYLWEKPLRLDVFPMRSMECLIIIMSYYPFHQNSRSRL